MMKRIAIIATIIVAVTAIVAISIWWHSTLHQPIGGLVEVNSRTVHSMLNPNSELMLDFVHYRGSIPPFALERFALSDEHDINSVYEMLHTQVSVELVRGRYIIIRTDIVDLQYVMIAPSVQTTMACGRNWFDIMPMQGRFFDQDVFSQRFWPIFGDSFATYIPYHLFDDASLYYIPGPYGSVIANNVYLAHQIGHYYRIYGNMADFRAFYESLGLYEIIETDDQLILTSSAHIMTLSFQEDNGQRYVAFSFELE